MAENILSSWEVEAFIENLQASNLENIGSKGWFEYHKKLMLLNQQSIFEISGLQEESVKEWFITFKKIPILVYEAIQIMIWKTKVFPLMIELYGEPTNTFFVFSVFYHEGISVSLLENVLYYSDSAETISDYIIDLIDYAVNYLTMLLYSDKSKASTDNSTCLDDLMDTKSKIEFDIGMRCISIIRYLAEFADNLPLCALSRMLSINDVPYLFSQLIELQPWKKRNDKGEIMIYNGKWEKLEDENMDKICNFEGQVWFGLRELLLNPKCAPYYDITEVRMSQLLKLQKYIQEHVLDQIAPLIELRRWLSYLNITSQTPNKQRPINVEMIPISNSIKEKHDKRWKRLAEHHAKTLFSKDIEHIKSMAQILSDAYDFDKLDIIDTKKCQRCKKVAKHRCSRCKESWYCGRYIRMPS
ncbi:PREDICTED: zinc finger MYND domain-containing protein 10 [Ceratosolen solmsi marchali]|uniref:Zinc finger MYND domain-containing protein 10 n=1 Tax=Ceratosolen solmsi marchali TaxID=326594 RepID=A0AAJ6VMH6_9HYME|nr:PREDICTED: zinc finger MYND domain-containing protein 10 [Ceratosolen solmsi marchali]